MRLQEPRIAPLPPEHRGTFIRNLRLVAGLPEEDAHALRSATAGSGPANQRPARATDAGAAKFKSPEPALND